MIQRLQAWQERVWMWFQTHARSNNALWWLALVSFADAIFFPIAPEVFLVALTLAHKERWKQYLLVAIPSSALGAATGYFIATFIFHQFGLPILQFYHLEMSFRMARRLIAGHVFWAMAVASFTPLPDKVFIYAGGFLGVRFVPFIAGYALGRSIRMTLFVFFTERYGRRALDLMARYFKITAALLVALGIIYGMVHFKVFGL